MEELQRPDAETYRQAPKRPVVLVLDNVRSMNNVGSVFRTADAFRVEEVMLAGITPRPPHREIRKTALGAEESVAWSHYPGIREALEACRQRGCQIVAVEQAHGSIPLGTWNPDPARPLALVFGHEVNGVSTAALSLADDCLEIPQEGTKHSLNLAVSVGIVLWQALGRHMPPSDR